MTIEELKKCWKYLLDLGKIDPRDKKFFKNFYRCLDNLTPPQLRAAEFVLRQYKDQIGHICSDCRVNDPVLQENQRVLKEEAKLLPYYKTTLEDQKVVFTGCRYAVDHEFEECQVFFKKVIRAVWKPNSKEIGPKKSRWVIPLNFLEEREDWREFVPKCIEVPLVILENKHIPEKRVYRDIVEGTRPYQIEAIEIMRA